MIPQYNDHAANERTYLAWLRTGIAVVAFGVVIERFDLFLRSITRALSREELTLTHKSLL
jgi:putative membrane protein